MRFIRLPKGFLCRAFARSKILRNLGFPDSVAPLFSIFAPSRQDKFLAMGWSISELNLSGFAEKDLNHLIGEALHLGCAGVVFYIIFLSSGPWWGKPPAGPTVPSIRLESPLVGDSASASSTQAAKRQRRTGCMPLPTSAL